jgi:hypothetical protein
MLPSKRPIHLTNFYIKSIDLSISAALSPPERQGERTTCAYDSGFCFGGVIEVSAVQRHQARDGGNLPWLSVGLR